MIRMCKWKTSQGTKKKIEVDKFSRIDKESAYTENVVNTFRKKKKWENSKNDQAINRKTPQ